MISYFQKFKEVTWPWTRPFRGYCIMHDLRINQHTTLEVPSFTDAKDMIGAKIKKGHLTLTIQVNLSSRG